MDDSDEKSTEYQSGDNESLVYFKSLTKFIATTFITYETLFSSLYVQWLTKIK